MSVHVMLDIIPQHIDPEAWASAYDDTLRLLRSHPSRLVGYAYKDIADIEVPVYSTALEHAADDPEERLYTVVGDLESKQMALAAAMYRDLGCYREDPSRPTTDILLLEGGATMVFAGDTQGHPYHQAVLAAAMVIEDRFPRAATVWGDIDRGQAVRAQEWAERVLGRPIALPVRADAPALWDRLSEFASGDALIRYFASLYCGESDEVLSHILARAGREAAERWFLGELIEFDQLEDPSARRLLIAWLNTTRDVGRLCELACLDARGPRHDPEHFIVWLAQTWLGVPREVSACFDPFLEPEGENPTLYTKVGGMLLDFAAVGRHLEARFSPESLDAALSRAFGQRAPELGAALHKETKRIIEGLDKVRDDVDSLVKRALANAEKDLEALLTLEAPERLSDYQLEHLRFLALIASRFRRRVEREDPEIFVPIIRSAAHAKTVLAGLVDDAGMVLTEQAWDWILAERDSEVLFFLATIATVPTDASQIKLLRRALFENEALCRHTFALSRDAEAMSQVAQKLWEPRRAERSKTRRANRKKR